MPKYANDEIAGAERWQRLPDDDNVAVAVDSFRMLADPTRLRILWLLCGGEADVTTLAERVGVARPTASMHLSKLRLAGLVATRRDGRRAVYQSRGQHVRQLLEQVFEAKNPHLVSVPERS